MEQDASLKNNPPQAPTTDHQRVIQLIQSGQLTPALELCTSLCKRNPADPDAWYLASVINGMQGNYPAVEACCQHVIALNPEAGPAYTNLGNALAFMGRQEEALAAYHTAAALNPNDPHLLINHGNLLLQNGDLLSATEKYRNALSLQPDIPELHNNLASCLQAQGDLAGAREHYAAAVKLQPAYTEALVNLSALLLMLGEPDRATVYARQALRTDPACAYAYMTLAATAFIANHPEEAIKHLQKSVSLQPNSPNLLCKAGRILDNNGHRQAACDYFTQALGLQPDYTAALTALGNTQRAAGKTDTAIAYFHKALEIDPRNAEALSGLAGINFHTGNNKVSERYYRQALEYNPDLFAAWCGLSTVLTTEGRYQEAEDCLNRAETTTSDRKQIILLRAGILERMGKEHAAATLLLPMLDDSQTAVRATVQFAAIAHHVSMETEAIFRLDKVLMKTNLPVQEKQNLLFAQGKLCDRIGEYDKAFHAYTEANLLAGRHFDDVMHSRHIDRIIMAYNRENMQKLPRASCNSRRPVFIVGMPRSGTSLAEQILSSHPRVFGAGELDDIADLAGTTNAAIGVGNSLPVSPNLLMQDELDRLANSYLQHLAELSDDELLVTDKMPYNYALLGFIQLLFPKARVIHCRRDPRDTCLSCLFQSFLGRHDFTHDLESLGHYYNNYQRLMQHWEQALDLEIYQLDYENMVNNQEEETRSLLEFCGLDWHDACMDFHRHARHVKTASYDQVRRPMYTSSIGRWKNYEQHIGPLTAILEQQGNLPHGS